MPATSILDLNSFLAIVAKNECKEDTTVILNDRGFGEKEAKLIANALASKNCKPRLTLELVDNQLGDKGIIAIARAFESGNCPDFLHLKLNGNYIRSQGIDALAKAFSSGKAPNNLTLELSGATSKYESNMTVFSHNMRNVIDDKCAEIIAKALKSNKWPSNLILDFKYTKITDMGVVALYNALNEYCPSQIRILLESKYLSDPAILTAFNSKYNNQTIMTKSC